MKTIKLQLAESWNQLTDKQVKKLAMLFFKGRPTTTLFDAAVFTILADNARNANTVLQEVPLSELKTFYPFIYKEHSRTKFVAQIKTGGKTYYPPMDKLQNLTAAEFATAEDLHRLWIEKREPEALHYLAAVLYTESRKPKRPAFDKLDLAEKHKIFAGLPMEELLAVELVYSGCKEFITKRFPKVFPKAASGTKGGKSAGFGEVILAMSGKKFGTHEETKAVNIYDFLAEFEENLKQAKHNGKNSHA